MPNVLISAIALSSIPKISYQKHKGLDLSKSLSKIFKTAYIFVLPCMVGLFTLSKPILSIVYPYLDAQMLFVATNLLKFSLLRIVHLHK